MSGSFGIEDGKILIRKDDRVVSTTDGSLMQFVTGITNFSANINFPDVPKREIYGFSWLSRYNFFEEVYRGDLSAHSFVGAAPQEWNNTIILGSVPNGADDFMGRISLTRTSSPSHSWWDSPMTVLPPQGVPIQLAGSILLEQQYGFARALTIQISGSNLIAFVQQSTGPGAGYQSSWGNASPPFAAPGNGGTNTSVGGPSTPIYRSYSNPYYKVVTGFEGSDPVSIWSVSGGMATYNKGGANQAVYSDPTNYSSTYSVNVSLRWGRRS